MAKILLATTDITTAIKAHITLSLTCSSHLLSKSNLMSIFEDLCYNSCINYKGKPYYVFPY